MDENSSDIGASREMPYYQCHKKVWALKIKAVQSLDGYRIIPEESGYGPIPVNAEYMDKHRPKAGGYYVVYDDGYKSFSPAEAFESGYTKIGPAPDNIALSVTFDFDAAEVHLAFAKPIQLLKLPSDEARRVANLLLLAAQAEGAKPSA